MKALDKDFLREVKNTRSRFLSILVLAALAVAFLSGLRSTSPDMKNTLDAYMDENEFMDVQVLSSLGVTDDDVRAMLERDEIVSGEGVYQLDAHALGGGNDVVVKLWSMPKEINRISVKKGAWPSSPQECLVDKKLISDLGVEIGDSISIVLEEGDDDEDDAPKLTRKDFVISGVAASPYYISVERGTSTIGTGSVGAFIYLDESAFDMDYYGAAFFTVKGAKELTAFSDEYDDLIDSVIDGLEDFAKERESIRYDEIVGKANDKLDDAQSELDDAKEEADEELGKAERELADARKELADARRELADAVTELEDARKELDDGWKELADAKQELADSIADAEKEIADAEKTLADALIELQDGEKEYEDGVRELDSGSLELDEGRRQLREGRAQLEAVKAQLDAFAPTAAQMEQGKLAIAAGIAQAEQGRAGYEAALAVATDPAIKMQIGYAIAGIDQQINGLNAQLAEIDSGLAQYYDGLAEYELGAAQLDKAADRIKSGERSLASGEKQLRDARKELDDGWKEYNDGLEELEDARRTLAEETEKAEKEIADAEKELIDGEKEYADGVTEYQDGEKEYTDGVREYLDGEKEYEDAKAEADEKIADAEEKIADAREKLGKIDECSWYVLSRDSNPGYLGFGQDADRIGRLAAVFPLLFFLVAALVCLTTMTRMVEDERTQIGALKALGYSRLAISKKYLAYGALPALIGGGLGLAIGYWLFPTVIFTAYQIMYEVPSIQIRSYPALSAFAVTASVACISLASLWGCFSSLAEVPAQLMRPRAPAAGKRVFLEYIKPLWSRMGFFKKLTARNLFRYKKRFWMTIIGIGGCTALIIAGFGLRSSLLATMDRQYGDIFRYDAMLSLYGDPDEAERAKIEDYIASSGLVADSMQIDVSSVSCETEKYKVGGILQVCEGSDISRFAELREYDPHQGGAKIELDDSGIIIGEKLSELLGVGPGDTFVIDRDGRYRVQVSAVNENYLGHYMYMTPAYYEYIFGEEYEPGSYLLKLADGSKESCDRLFEGFMKLDGAGAATRIADTKDTYIHSMERVDIAVVIIIISAAALAIVVLYNLSNINITEREREIATIKVLGFFDGEVSAYIYRENVILTIMGIALGLVMGHWLHVYLVRSVEIELMMFGRDTDPMSYVWAALLTVLFSVIVNVMAHFKMKKIDMSASLKSAE